MSDDSFSTAIKLIAKQAGSERRRELSEQRRRKNLGKIRQASVFILGAVALGCLFYFRHDIERYASNLGGDPPKIDGETAMALKELQAESAKFKHALDELAK